MCLGFHAGKFSLLAVITLLQFQQATRKQRWHFASCLSIFYISACVTLPTVVNYCSSCGNHSQLLDNMMKVMICECLSLFTMSQALSTGFPFVSSGHGLPSTSTCKQPLCRHVARGWSGTSKVTLVVCFLGAIHLCRFVSRTDPEAVFAKLKRVCDTYRLIQLAQLGCRPGMILH